MRLIGGSIDSSSVIGGRPNIDYVTVVSSSNGESELRLYASDFWVVLHDGVPSVIGVTNRTAPERLFPDLILLDEPSAADRSMVMVPSEVMEYVLDPEVSIGDRKKSFIESVAPCFNAYTTAHKEQLLRKLLGGLQTATDSLPTLERVPRELKRTKRRIV